MNMGSYQEMCHCYHNYAQPICILHPLYIFSDTTSRVFTAILLIFDNLSYMFKLNFSVQRNLLATFHRFWYTSCKSYSLAKILYVIL